jgi:hypothetical protein
VRAGEGKEKRKKERGVDTVGCHPSNNIKKERGKGRREKEEEEEGGKRTNGI